MFVFNVKKLFYKCKSSFTPKSEMNTPQAEGNVNSRLYSRGRSSKKLHEEYRQEKKVQDYSAITKMKHKFVIFA